MPDRSTYKCRGHRHARALYDFLNESGYPVRWREPVDKLLGTSGAKVRHL